MRQIKAREIEITISRLDQDWNMYTRDRYTVEEFSNGIVYSEDADCFVASIFELTEEGYIFDYEYTGKVFFYSPKEIAERLTTITYKYGFGEVEKLGWELVRQALSKSYANI